MLHYIRKLVGSGNRGHKTPKSEGGCSKRRSSDLHSSYDSGIDSANSRTPSDRVSLASQELLSTGDLTPKFPSRPRAATVNYGHIGSVAASGPKKSTKVRRQPSLIQLAEFEILSNRLYDANSKLLEATPLIQEAIRKCSAAISKQERFIPAEIDYDRLCQNVSAEIKKITICLEGFGDDFMRRHETLFLQIKCSMRMAESYINTAHVLGECLKSLIEAQTIPSDAA